MKKIRFFTTEGCHLCDEAYAMLGFLMQENTDIFDTLCIEVVEISEDDSLVEKYGSRIPVLALYDKELGWPFSLEVLKSWLTH